MRELLARKERKTDGPTYSSLNNTQLTDLWIFLLSFLGIVMVFEAIIFYVINKASSSQAETARRWNGAGEVVMMKGEGEAVLSRPPHCGDKGEHHHHLCVNKSDPPTTLGIELTVEEGEEAGGREARSLDSTSGGSTAVDEEEGVRTTPAHQLEGGSHSLEGGTTHDNLAKFLPAIDGMRILGALHIAVFHFYGVEDGIPVNGGSTCYPCQQGYLWVPFFFFISGFVSYKGCARTNTPTGGLDLFIKRYKALFPLLLAGNVIIYFSLMRQNIYVHSTSIAHILLLIETWMPPFSTGHLNAPQWFISSLAASWLLLPHWCYAAKRASRALLGALFAILSLASFVPWILYDCILNLNERDIYGIDSPAIVNNAVTASPYSTWRMVAFGMLTAAWLDRFPGGVVRRRLERVGASLSVSILFLFFALYKKQSTAKHPVSDKYYFIWVGPPIYVVSFLFLVGCSSTRDPMSRALAYISKGGEYALPLYLLHMPAMNFLNQGLELYSEIGDAVVYLFVVLPLVTLVFTITGKVMHDKWISYLRQHPYIKRT